MRRLPVLVLAAAVLATAACSGDDGAASPGDSGRGPFTAGEAGYEIRESQCDGIRAAGTITNTSGAEAAFEITAVFTYGQGASGLPVQTTVTEVLADGESAEFSISSDRSGSAPSGCRIAGAEIVDAGADGGGSVGEVAVPDALDEGWVAVGGGGTIVVSEDGETWAEVAAPTDETLVDVAFADGQWVAVGLEGVVLVSSDGVIWTEGTVGSEAVLDRIRYAEGRWEARLGNSDDVFVSPDGVTWTLQDDVYAVDPSDPDHAEPFTVTDAGGGRELAIGRPGSYGGAVLLREDGGEWAPVRAELERETGSPLPQNGLSAEAFATDGDGRWVLVGGINERQFVVSDDLETWTAVAGDAFALSDVGYADGRWVAVGDRGRIYTSSDGEGWERLLPQVTDTSLNGVAHTG